MFFAGIAQLVEHQLPKLRVAGSSPVSRSFDIGFLMLDLEGSPPHSTLFADLKSKMGMGG